MSKEFNKTLANQFNRHLTDGRNQNPNRLDSARSKLTAKQLGELGIRMGQESARIAKQNINPEPKIKPYIVDYSTEKHDKPQPSLQPQLGFLVEQTIDIDKTKEPD